MNKKVTKQDDKQIAKRMSHETLEAKLKKDIYALDKKSVLDKLIDLFEDYSKEENRNNEDFENKLWRELKKAYGFKNFENHYFLVDTVSEKFRPFLADFTNQIIKEYDCKSTTEKSLAQLIAGSFAKIMYYSQTLKGLTDIEYLSHEKNGYYSLLSKEIDRSYRQYTTSLMTLKQLKSPSISVKVNAQAAYMATNQQINLKESEIDENIKPK